MKLIVNGEELVLTGGEVGASPTVTQLVAQLGLENQRVAVEVNQEIVRRATWGERALQAGDVIEVVHFVGGGSGTGRGGLR